MSAPPSCPACERSGTDLASESARVRSNVRAFESELFGVWRCRHCRSLHASEEVELARYYRKYPFFALPDDLRLRVMYDNQLRRLRRAGVRREHRILDYGSGSGSFVRHLRARGFSQVFGYDRYSTSFDDAAVLKHRFDCVISQDVLEHVPEPLPWLDEIGNLVEPGGVIALGTPNADAIRLDIPERHVHALHLPFHRHIFSKQALIAAGEQRGWRLEHYYPTQYANTAVPFLNSRFYLYYMRLRDNSLDCLLEPPRLAPLLARLPLTLFWGIFGALFAEETDVMMVFRR